MATSQDYIEYVCGQIKHDGIIRYRKMFGEYMVYLNDKPVLLVCDNTVFIKMLPAVEEIMRTAETGYPYDGAKEHYILDVDDEFLFNKAVSILETVTPISKKSQKIRY